MQFSKKLNRQVVDDRHEWLLIKRRCGKLAASEMEELISMETETLTTMRQRMNLPEVPPLTMRRLAEESIRSTN